MDSADSRNLSNPYGVTRVNIKVSTVSHKKALVLALVGIVGGLAISVASFAATSSTSSLSIAASSGLSGEFGFVVSQGTPATQMFISDGAGTTTVSVTDSALFAVGDHILIDENADGVGGGTSSFHTVTANDTDADELTVSPAFSASTYSTSASVSEPSQYSGVHTWTPALNSATSVAAGNHFIVNLKGLTTNDDAFVEVITTNPNELVKNYTYLNRTVGVYVLCTDSSQCSASTPYKSATDSGSYGSALDSTGNDINLTADILTLQNARQQFVLKGGYVYALTVEGGALFTIDTATTTGDSLSPTDQVGITAR